MLTAAIWLAAALGALWAVGKAHTLAVLGGQNQQALIDEIPGKFWMLRRFDDESGFQDPHLVWLYYLPVNEATRLATSCKSNQPVRLWLADGSIPDHGCLLAQREDGSTYYHATLAGRWLEVDLSDT